MNFALVCLNEYGYVEPVEFYCISKVIKNNFSRVI